MIMKANKQIGFIYKNEESIDKILKDGEVVFERGFLRERTSTTLPITFGGVGKDLKDYKIYGNTKQQILPDGYTQVDYIETDGGQYIDTGYYGNLNTEIQVKASTSIGTGRQLFGDITTNSSAISCNINLDGQQQTTRFGDKQLGVRNWGITLNTIFNLKENKNGIYVDNVEIGVFNATDDFATDNTLLLLNRNSESGATSKGWQGTLYFCKIYDNNVLVRDFIPCYRNSDNEVGLYDLVNNAFYTNQGTGVFTYGSVAPTPNAPIEMISCGDRTKNLLGFGATNNGKGTQTTYDKKTGLMTTVGTTTASYPWANEFDTNIPSGTSLTINSNSQYQIIARLYYNSSNYEEINSTTGSSKTLTHNIIKIALLINIPANTTINETYYVQIEEGTTATSYEPYGYKIPINIKSENLFNMQYTNAYIGGVNAKTYEDRNTTAKTAILKCEPNTTYAIKKFENSNRFYVFDFPRIAVRNDELNPLYQNSDVSECTVTTNADAEYLYIYVSTGSEAKTPLMVVSESSIIPQKYVAYLDETKNIYLNEPLRNIKDTIYKDYIDFINQKIYRQIGEIKISNYSNFSVNSVANKFVQYLTSAIENLKLNIRDGENAFFCNYINSFGGSTASSSKIRINIPHEYLGTTQSSTATEVKQALLNLMNGKTMEFVYPLETPTEESITLPNIPTVDGNNTLNIETEITPSQVYIKYKSNE